MDAITLWAPWSDLIAIGAKRVETRSWPAPVVGRWVAIHSAKRMDDCQAEALVCNEDVLAAFEGAGVNPFTGTGDEGFTWTDADVETLTDVEDPKAFLTKTRGCVLAVARLIGCYRMERGTRGVGYKPYEYASLVYPSPTERAFGDWSPGRFAWVFGQIIRLPEPIPARGYQQVWQWDAPESVLSALSTPAPDDAGRAERP